MVRSEYAHESRSERLKSQRGPATAMLRIVGGKMRGRKLTYSGDPRVRPMKDRTREAVFNLVGPLPEAIHALDLFAGTGAMGIEAVSRGATGATLIELHEPTARQIRANVAALDLDPVATVVSADAFRWTRQNSHFPAAPWLVFCCPPYRLFAERRDDLLEMLERLVERAPADSIFVVESDKSFDPALLPRAASWRSRDYAPARVAVL